MPHPILKRFVLRQCSIQGFCKRYLLSYTANVFVSENNETMKFILAKALPGSSSCTRHLALSLGDLWRNIWQDVVSSKIRSIQSVTPHWLNTDVIGFCKGGIEKLVYRWHREKYTTRTARFPSTHISVWAKKLALLVYARSLYIAFIKGRDHENSERSEVSCIRPEAHKSVPRAEIVFLLFSF